jgi:para-aminobenzoate synthetase component 1
MENLIQKLAYSTNENIHIPFHGGILGNIDYEFGNRHTINKIVSANFKPANPSMLFAGLYLWAFLQNQKDQTAYLYIHPECPKNLKQTLLNIDWVNQNQKKTHSSFLPSPFKLISPFKSSHTKQEYQQNFNAIKNYIYAGDCYQVNLTQRFEATYQGDPISAFHFLHKKVLTPFSAYLDIGDTQILSFSPERFLLIDNGEVETKPIKGTRPRHENAEKDNAFKSALSSSTKDRAENLMIVDLLRNDLGKFCETGSIKVPSLFAIESFHNVHHLVSTVTGRLKKTISPIRLLLESMPGGSITGAPKLRAMEIIAELELHSRQAYCGSLFMWSASGRLDSNIAIRTMVCEKGKIYCWGGGGIVADSQLEEEYQESIQKVSKLMQLLELPIYDEQNDKP